MQQVDQQQNGQQPAGRPPAGQQPSGQQDDFTSELARINEELKKVNDTITKSTNTLQEERKKQETLQAQLAPLAKIEAQKKQGSEAATKDRDAATELVKRARDELETNRTNLRGQLSDERRTALQDGVKSIDDGIETQETAVNETSMQLETAKQELADLQSQSKQAEAAVNVALGRQRNLSKEIQAATAKVQAVQKVLTGAGQDLSKSYLLTVELEKAITALETVADAKEETDRTKAVTDAAAAYATSLQENRAKADEVKNLEEKLKTAGADLDKARKERQQKIDALLKPAAPAAKPAVPAP